MGTDHYQVYKVKDGTDEWMATFHCTEDYVRMLVSMMTTASQEGASFRYDTI